MWRLALQVTSSDVVTVSSQIGILNLIAKVKGGAFKEGGFNARS